MKTEKELIPFSKALIQIFLSTLIISGSATLLWLYTEHARVVGSKDDRHNIVGLVQTGPQRNQLPTDYLIEVLALSVDEPTNLYLLNIAEAEKRLLATPFIKTAKVKKVQPNALSVDYTIRTPIARMLNQPGMGVGVDGMQFPLAPFYQERDLPLVDFQEENFDLLLEVLAAVPDALLVDVSQAQSEQYGKREIVVRASDGVYLRLHPSRIEAGLRNYEKLRTCDPDEITAVDLRLQQLAFFVR